MRRLSCSGIQFLRKGLVQLYRAVQDLGGAAGTTAAGTKAADLAADSPYLLAAEATDTKVAFTATASAGSPIVKPSTTSVTLGDALANGVFLFQANPNLANLTLSGIYVLKAEGTRFDLHESA